MERNSRILLSVFYLELAIGLLCYPTLSLSDSALNTRKDSDGSTQSKSATPSIVFPLLAPKFSSAYGSRQHPVFHGIRHHNGLDIAAPEYSHVRTVLEGIVIFADSYSGFGKLVTIQHKGGTASLYGHLSEVRVNVGQRVKTGEIIGRVGSTGWSTGAHLHFEWRKNGVSIDPLSVFPHFFEDAKG